MNARDLSDGMADTIGDPKTMSAAGLIWFRSVRAASICGTFESLCWLWIEAATFKLIAEPWNLTARSLKALTEGRSWRGACEESLCIAKVQNILSGPGGLSWEMTSILFVQGL